MTFKVLKFNFLIAVATLRFVRLVLDLCGCFLFVFSAILRRIYARLGVLQFQVCLVDSLLFLSVNLLLVLNHQAEKIVVKRLIHEHNLVAS